jgi:hypothetical protein
VLPGRPPLSHTARAPETRLLLQGVRSKLDLQSHRVLRLEKAQEGAGAFRTVDKVDAIISPFTVAHSKPGCDRARPGRLARPDGHSGAETGG